MSHLHGEAKWPMKAELETLRSALAPDEGLIFFEVRTLIDFAVTLVDGSVLSSETLPSLCVRISVPISPNDHRFIVVNKVLRRLHVYTNAVAKTDLSWRTIGLVRGATLTDRYQADPERTSTIVGRLFPRNGVREPGNGDVAILGGDILGCYRRGIGLAFSIVEGSPLDRVLLSYGQSFTHAYADEQVIALWRTLESAAKQTVPAERPRRKSTATLVHNYIEGISTNWSREHVANWWALRNKLVHEGISDSLLEECTNEIQDLYDCVDEVVEYLVRPLPELPGRRTSSSNSS